MKIKTISRNIAVPAHIPMNQPDVMGAWLSASSVGGSLFEIPSEDRPGQNVVRPVTCHAREILGFYLKNGPLQLSSTFVQIHQPGIRHCMKHAVKILSLINSPNIAQILHQSGSSGSHNVKKSKLPST
jgi:hypothetical protein